MLFCSDVHDVPPKNPENLFRQRIDRGKKAEAEKDNVQRGGTESDLLGLLASVGGSAFDGVCKNVGHLFGVEL
jgi:hypothetical protein